jgi:hypothetical protein
MLPVPVPVPTTMALVTPSTDNVKRNWFDLHDY